MVFLAELNDNNICIGTKRVNKIINDGKHVEIEVDDFDFYVWRKYKNGQWSEEKFEPNYPQIELGRMEALEQSQTDQDEIIMMLLLGGM